MSELISKEYLKELGILNYEKDLEVDKDNLDYEWVRQASLYDKWNKAFVFASRESERLEERLDQIKSEVDDDIRRNPEKFSLDKVTESAIKSKLSNNKKVIKAKTRYLDMLAVQRTIAGALKALEHKRKALERLVDLHICGYVQRDIPDESRRETVNKVRKEIRKDLNRRMRDNKVFDD